MTEKYVINERNIQILWLKTSIFQIFRKTVMLEQLTHCLTIFFKFLKKRTGLARTYTTPLPCFQRKLKKVQQDIIKQPANCINKTKRDIKKKINDLDTEYPDIFIGDSCQKLLIVKDVLVYFGKYVNAFVFNGSLLEDRSRYGYNVNIIYATNSLLISVANQSVTEEVKRGKTLFLKIK